MARIEKFFRAVSTHDKHANQWGRTLCFFPGESSARFYAQPEETRTHARRDGRGGGHDAGLVRRRDDLRTNQLHPRDALRGSGLSSVQSDVLRRYVRPAAVTGGGVGLGGASGRGGC